MSQVRAVLFDLDATLLDYDDDAWADTVRRVCADLGQDGGPDPDQLFSTYTGVSLAHWQAAEKTVVRAASGSVDGLSVWTEHWRESLAACGDLSDRLARRAARLYQRHRHARYRLYDDVTATLTALRSQVDGLAIVTNGPDDTQRDKLAVTGLDGLVDVVVTSGGAGVAKPHEAIFALALRELAVPAASAWHVGDSLATDVAGARNARCGGAVWLNRRGIPGPAGGPAPSHEIASLRELTVLIGQSAAPVAPLRHG